MNTDVYEGKISRRRFLTTTTIAVAACSVGLKSCTQSASSNRLLQLAHVGDRFTFALVADPQVKQHDVHSFVPRTSQSKLSKIIEELNQINPQLPFVVFNGDAVQSAQPHQIQNFLDRVKQLDSPAILVHGNHDGHFPYIELKQMQTVCNGTNLVEFSFDCGQWHFITFPCDFDVNTHYTEHLLKWLDADLYANRHKPTMVFEHYHLLPQGLTSLTWYTYDRSMRQRLVDQLAKYGNVRYVICGHVHNGIQASMKTAWTYRDINFITAPTCTASRNFGEEYPQFQAGMPNSKDTGGGYYLLIDIQGETAQLRGRLVGVKDEFVYPRQFKPYADQEPLWFKSVADQAVNPTIVNPSFDQGLQGWMQPYRYVTDVNPGFIAQPAVEPSQNRPAAYLFCREKGQIWARDEVMEIYQMVQLPAGGSPVFMASYCPQTALSNGGGYIRLVTYSGSQLQVLMLFDWSDGHKDKSVSVSRYIAYTAGGERDGVALAIQRLGRQKRAIFWELPSVPEQWHQMRLSLDTLYDRAVQQEGAFAALAVDRILVSVGVWCLAWKGSQSGAFFDDLTLTVGESEQAALVVDDQAIDQFDETIFQTGFTKTAQSRRDELENL